MVLASPALQGSPVHPQARWLQDRTRNRRHRRCSAVQSGTRALRPAILWHVGVPGICCALDKGRYQRASEDLDRGRGRRAQRLGCSRRRLSSLEREPLFRRVHHPVQSADPFAVNRNVLLLDPHDAHLRRLRLVRRGRVCGAGRSKKNHAETRNPAAHTAILVLETALMFPPV